MQAEQNKDPTERQMAKIAREAAKFTVQMMKADGIGTAEFDFIHLVRHNPGMTQADVRAALKMDKGRPPAVRPAWKPRATWCANRTRTMAAASCCMPRQRPRN